MLVEAFYRSEEVSRMMPGKKDVGGVVTNGVKKPIKKQLILCNLNISFRRIKIKKKMPLSPVSQCCGNWVEYGRGLKS